MFIGLWNYCLLQADNNGVGWITKKKKKKFGPYVSFLIIFWSLATLILAYLVCYKKILICSLSTMIVALKKNFYYSITPNFEVYLVGFICIKLFYRSISINFVAYPSKIRFLMDWMITMASFFKKHLLLQFLLLHKTNYFSIL